jgi:ketosteroid isomerase-like protein
MVVFFLLLSATCFAQHKLIDSSARGQIDAGNQAWIDGMKQGRVALIAATYTADAVDCSPTGDCIRGRSDIEDHMKEEVATLGKADSASVTSIGSVQHGHFIYEWGQAEAHFPSGRKIVDHYLTAWQEQPDGTATSIQITPRKSAFEDIPAVTQLRLLPGPLHAECVSFDRRSP